MVIIACHSITLFPVQTHTHVLLVITQNPTILVIKTIKTIYKIYKIKKNKKFLQRWSKMALIERADA